MTSKFNGIWFGQNAKKHYIFCGKYSGVHGKRYQDKILGNQICCIYLHQMLVLYVNLTKLVDPWDL